MDEISMEAAVAAVLSEPELKEELKKKKKAPNDFLI